MLLHEEPWIEFLWARLGIIYCVVNDILTALDNDNIPVLLLLDLSAAFDTIDHQISSPASILFLVFSLLHSNGSSHISQTS